MKRASFLRLTGLTPDQVKTRLKLGQMPYQSADGWKDYTPFEVFLVNLTSELASRGVGLHGAANQVRKSALSLREQWQRISAGREDFYFAVAQIDQTDHLHGETESAIIAREDLFDHEKREKMASLEGWHALSEMRFVGSMSEIASQLSALSTSPGTSVQQVIIRNASQVWRSIQIAAHGDSENDPLDISAVFGDEGH